MMMRRLRAPRQREGFILIIAALILTTALIVVMVGQRMTNTNISTSRMMRNKIAAGYEAETLLHLTLSFIRSATSTEGYNIYTNEAKATYLYNAFDVGAGHEIKDLTDCEEEQKQIFSLANDCRKVTDNGRTICNFLCDDVEKTGVDRGFVSLVRHKDFTDTIAGHMAGVYLATARIFHADGTVQRAQAVIMVPIYESGQTANRARDFSLPPFMPAQTMLD